ncbi:hypothetical protein B296_00034506 [Ensete ventricosum]|uniref:Uncharacterized protein n=1 Tax=Ensete ventricosum TaxID=4639 RepID=A0A427A8D4_ENSVE|nr:hypothetical protein B296_00034506 [Ensete ventricosum]
MAIETLEFLKPYSNLTRKEAGSGIPGANRRSRTALIELGILHRVPYASTRFGFSLGVVVVRPRQEVPQRSVATRSHEMVIRTVIGFAYLTPVKVSNLCVVPHARGPVKEAEPTFYVGPTTVSEQLTEVRGIANSKNSVLMQGLVCGQWSNRGYPKSTGTWRHGALKLYLRHGKDTSVGD